MKFENTKSVPLFECHSFWSLLDENYTVSQMYDEHENVLVTLKDKFATCQFIYFKSKRGRAVRFLDEQDEYVGTVFFQNNGRMGGKGEGERGKRKVIQCKKMLKKAIETGSVEIIVERNDAPPSQHIPLTDREKTLLSLLSNNVAPAAIKEKLGITESNYRRMRKSLMLKGELPKGE
ncbi:helix-turn-helix transcriptional regulator [Guptibacillus spartinae]|uniref:helix-turn-helix transcriptional regulator n=1 Tax=Guptibacillus spartinae TaxID=3025679 RepID=UPI00235F60A3|nr:hypothetical protein [Pseudalkalibacillus spartinae]